MATFGKKILGLTAAAIGFAGMAFGQTCATGSAQNTFIRGEGTTELIGTITVNCTGLSAGSLTAQLFLSPGVPLTSRLLTGSTTQTEATIAATGGATAAGTLSSNSVNFVVAVPAGAVTLTISGVRVNANSLTLTTGLPPAITGTVFTSGAALNNTSSTANVGSVASAEAGLGTAKLYKGVSSTGTITSSGTNSFSVCNSASVAAPGFVVQVNEGFNTAFKSAADETNGGLAATTATRIALNFGNLPQNGLTAYLPQTVKTAISGSPATLTLTATATGPTTALTALSSGSTYTSITNYTNGSNPLTSLYGAPVAFPVSGGNFVAFYEVTTDDLNQIDSYNIPVFFGAAANPGNASGTSTVSVSFAPVGSSNVPNFTQTSSTTALNASSFNLCTTSLLFPFVTNASGFDTGMAISNTSVDPFGSNGATAQGGTCTLNFYGATTNPAAITTASVAAGTVYTNLVSTLAAGFQGYMIAQCNFQFAHGFAFITDGFGGGGRGLSQGYLALVIPDTNQQARRNLAAGESLTN